MSARSAAVSQPFGPNGAFFLTEEQLEALSRLLFVVENQRDFAVVCGPAGVGKTRLLEELQRQSRAAGKFVIRIDAGGLDRRELPQALLAACQTWSDSHSAWQTLEDVIAGRGLSGNGGVWIVDHVERAAEDLTVPLHRLLQLLGRRDVRGTAIIATNRPGQLAPLIDRADWHIELHRWTAEDTAAAIERLQGHGSLPRFSSAAIREIAEAAEGCPATTLRLCELAVLAAELHGAATIDADLVREAGRQRTMPRTDHELWTAADEQPFATLWRD
ncbi:MAG: ATP-binding protein [Planctomycetaceae bacterium]|nr:ATP-binding protein [Planctomycetaceae bacterium]